MELTRSKLTVSLCAVLLSSLAFAVTSRAQEALYVKDGDAMSLVVAAQQYEPMVWKNGKLDTVGTRWYVLKKVPEYDPVFVSVRHVRVDSIALNNHGVATNTTFHFYADFDSPFPLEHVFVVLDLSTQEAGKLMLVQEVGKFGKLVPGKSESVVVDYEMPQGIGSGHYQLHVFTEGREVLTSTMPAALRERVLDRMVAKRNAGVADRLPQLFMAPPPEYPSAFRQAGSPGQATLRFRIGEHGEVLEPKVVNATDPAFGSAALDAVQLWRFLPKISGGKPVAVTVQYPFNFAL